MGNDRLPKIMLSGSLHGIDHKERHVKPWLYDALDDSAKPGFSMTWRRCPRIKRQGEIP